MAWKIHSARIGPPQGPSSTRSTFGPPWGPKSRSRRPDRWDLRDEAPVPVTFPPNPSRPGRLVAATACPGRHETPGTPDPNRSGHESRRLSPAAPARTLTVPDRPGPSPLPLDVRAAPRLVPLALVRAALL